MNMPVIATVHELNTPPLYPDFHIHWAWGYGQGSPILEVRKSILRGSQECKSLLKCVYTSVKGCRIEGMRIGYSKICLKHKMDLRGFNGLIYKQP